MDGRPKDGDLLGTNDNGCATSQFSSRPSYDAITEVTDLFSKTREREGEERERLCVHIMCVCVCVCVCVRAFMLAFCF